MCGASGWAVHGAALKPDKISFRVGGYITGVIGILIFPWKLIADPQGYIFKWLIAYSGLLGPVGGIMIADYYLVRRMKLVTAELYSASGPCWSSRKCRPSISMSVVTRVSDPGVKRSTAQSSPIPRTVRPDACERVRIQSISSNSPEGCR